MADETGEPIDFFQAWDWVFEIEGIPVAGFTTAGPLKQEHALIVQHAGGARTPIDETPGRYTTEKIKCTRGHSINSDLWDWHNNVKAGNKDKRNCSLVQQVGGVGVLRWNLPLCNIVSYQAGDFGDKDENVIEEIEIKPIDLDRAPA